MTPRTLGRWIRPRAAALVIALGSAGGVTASDNPPVVVPGPAIYPGAPCPNCVPNTAPVACQNGTCGHAKHGTKCKIVYQTQLRPGACFGYFQTQWNRWEDVCPVPYQGVGLNDAPRVPTRPVAGPQTPLGAPNKLPEVKGPPLIEQKVPTPDPKPMPEPRKDPKGGLDLPKPPALDPMNLPSVPPIPGNLP